MPSRVPTRGEKAHTGFVTHQLEVSFVHVGASLGVYGPVVIAVIHGADRSENAERAVQEMRKLRRTTHSKELHYVYVVIDEAEMPSAKTREVAATLPTLVDTVIGVHEGEGFRASVVRAVVTGIGMVSGSLPTVVSTTREAANKLASLHPNVGPAEDLRIAIDKLRGVALAAK